MSAQKLEPLPTSSMSSRVRERHFLKKTDFIFKSSFRFTVKIKWKVQRFPLYPPPPLPLWASLVTQLIKNPPAMWETWV